MLFMILFLLQSGAVHLSGTHFSAFIESLDKQLRTYFYDPIALETTIAPETWRILNAQTIGRQEPSDVRLVQRLGRRHLHQGTQDTLPG